MEVDNVENRKKETRQFHNLHDLRVRVRHQMEKIMEIQTLTITQYKNRQAADKLRHIKNSDLALEFLEYLEALLRDDEEDLVAAIDAFFEEMH